jgi:catechol 2,3-dioxygenase-like lactoylglutathione lyase family enzyme
MQKPPNAQLTHMGIHCKDLDAMIDFYINTLGLVLTDRGDYYMGGEIAFLSRSPDEHHQMVLASGRSELKVPSPINQISFRVDDLEDLITYHQQLLLKKVPIQRAITHGNAWSIYFFDPEENRIELYTPSPWYVEQPFGIPIDLTDSVENILRTTKDFIKDNPTLTSQNEWSQGLKAKIFN